MLLQLLQVQCFSSADVLKQFALIRAARLAFS
jgi:hypothetical protein